MKSPTRTPAFAICALICASLALPATARAQTDDLPIIARQLVGQLLPTSEQAQARARDIKAWTSSLAPDGHWPDIRYDDTHRGSWNTVTHLTRTLQLAEVYASTTSPWHADPALLHAVRLSLDWWLAHDYRSANWWHNEINVPRLTAFVLLLMRDDLSADERAAALKIIARAKIGMTGQNRVWLAGDVLMRAILEDDAPLARQARDVINAQISIANDEGLQIDHSFRQHGPQLQLGNYGLAFASDGLFWMQALRGTDFALDPGKAKLLRDYLFLGERAVVWHGFMDISSCGRQLTPDSQRQKARSVATLLNSIQEPVTSIDTFVGNTLFWRTDYMVDRRPGYLASVRMNSTRTQGAEVVNSENLSGRYLGDGALFLYKTGAEYENIFPVWDWRKIPGVTCSADGPVRPVNKTGANGADFVGGVSDGHDGLAAMIYDRDGVRAKKSWFFLENRIVCLGADITAPAGQILATTVNQCLLHGPVLAGRDGQVDALPSGVRPTIPALRWAWHDDVGYVFLQPADATIGGATQTGSWHKNVYEAGSPATVSKDVFALWINHPPDKVDASYAYVILPAATADETQAYSKTGDIEIIADTAALQAVRRGPVTAAVFYQPGRLACAPGREIVVDHPCLVLVAADHLAISDPTQKLARLTLTCNGRAQTIALPSGLDAGQSVVVSTH